MLVLLHARPHCSTSHAIRQLVDRCHSLLLSIKTEITQSPSESTKVAITSSPGSLSDALKKVEEYVFDLAGTMLESVTSTLTFIAKRMEQWSKLNYLRALGRQAQINSEIQDCLALVQDCFMEFQVCCC
jgi:hypothetical protein